MENVLKILTKNLQHDVTEQIERRYKAMISQYDYLKESKDINLILTRKHKWNDKKYMVVFALNSFYQVVIGPLTCSAYGLSASGLGSRIPIKYGSSMIFDDRRNSAVRAVDSDFNTMLIEFGFPKYLVAANRASDITYYLANMIKKDFLDE